MPSSSVHRKPVTLHRLREMHANGEKVVARELTRGSPIPTVGIGAGVGCSGQVLVLHDMLGVTAGTPLRFVRNFLEGSAGIEPAVRQYVSDVKAGRFPDDNIHAF